MKLRLAEIMRRRGISQYKLAKLSDVPISTVYRVLKRGSARISTLEKFAKVLGISIKDLFEE